MHQRSADIVAGAGRLVDMEGVFNFRDFGGYPVPGGGRVRQGLLWRSGQHAGASDADLARIDAIGLASIHDLRTDRERQSHPCRRPAGFVGAVHIAADGHGDTASAPHLRAARDAARARAMDAAGMRERLRLSYAIIPFRPPLLAALRAYMADLATADGPVLVNCMAGKDRTGIAVAMAQTVLGVHADDIMADYLLTNTLGDQAARIAAGGRTVSTLVGDLEPEALRVLMGVEPDYLHTAYSAMAEAHGSIGGYLEQALGVDAFTRDAIRARFIAA